ncbi:MAG: RNA 3'-terminal phosphate cyclase [Candidatus Kariarchaeaceae archaeon]|jgi:RNA 3'-terminal phosphate cyclase (ATP)
MQDSSKPDIEIDGSIGGGSVLRVAVPLALAGKKSIRIRNIRSKRKSPGLRLQHLAGLQVLADLTNSSLIGGEIGSTEVFMYPKEPYTVKNVVKQVSVELRTAASVSLIVQALVHFVAASKHTVELTFNGGGSHTAWSPNFDYLEGIALPMFHRWGIGLSISLNRIGFYPKGGAKGVVTIKPVPFVKQALESSDLDSIEVICTASNQLKNARVAERQLDGFLESKLEIDKSKFHYSDTENPGTACTGIIHYSNKLVKGASELGKRGVKAEVVGNRAANYARNEIASKASVDQYMADQLLVPLAFSPAGSSFTIPSITPHVEANLAVIQKILGDCILLEESEAFVHVIRK